MSHIPFYPFEAFYGWLAGGTVRILQSRIFMRLPPFRDATPHVIRKLSFWAGGEGTTRRRMWEEFHGVGIIFCHFVWETQVLR